MSMGGDFFSISDEQLQRLLDKTLDYRFFLYEEMEEKPCECYSKGEHIWYELTRLLSDEDACGIEQTDVIPEFSGYSFSEDVHYISRRLEMLSEDEIRNRLENEEIEVSLEEISDVVKGLKEFYQRAASKRNAVLFRVT